MDGPADASRRLTGNSGKVSVDGAITTRQWLVSLALAAGAHLYVSGMFPLTDAQGAEDLGEQGIEVDLGMLGDMGELMETSTMSQSAAASIPEQAPEEIVEPPVVQPEPELLEEKPERIARVKPEKPTALFRADLDVRRPEPFEKKPVQQSRLETAVHSRPAVDSAAMAKMTTGQAHAQSAGGNPDAERSYLALLAARLRSQKHYPLSARRRKDEGKAILFLVIARQGEVVEARIIQSSGIPALDASVLRMLEKAKPLPPFLPEMRQSNLAVNIPVVFRLDDRLD